VEGICAGGQGGLTAARIWDLRRGDADDNRTSPHVHGLRSVLISAALEFHYLKASVSFLALIIGPALLVGLAPSVVVTYGRLKLETAAMAGRSPIFTLVLLAVLVGAALWLGRAFGRLAVDNFWDLHYTLVFPIFVAVREMICMVAERVPSRVSAPEQIHRRRRLGTILAALLLAGGGMGLAIGVIVSIGLQLVDVRQAQFWAMAKAALVNAAVVLGLSTAAESLYWLWRELALSSPVLDWAPSSSRAESPAYRVAHLSDLHLVGERYGYRMEAGTHGPRGNRRIRRVLGKLAAIHALTPLHHILITGDVTDAGTRAEWAEFLDLLRGHPELRARLSFVPGNHDVNIVDRANPGHLDLPWSAGLALRKLRVVLALDAIQGERAHVVDRASGALGPSLKDYLRKGERVERLRALAQCGAVRGRMQVAKIWDAIFPLVEPAPRDDGYGIILLNSNSRGYFSLTSAIGVINPSQLSALRSILRNSPHTAWALVLHHQVVEYPVATISLRDRIGLALVNGPDVLAAIAPHASRLLVFHGHRHRDWTGTCGELVLCSAPSAMLGSHEGEKYRGSFRVHQLALGLDGGLRLMASERIEVA
jgi:3',5'-cyclic AMP phosphodiesterase CpdA